MSICSTLLNVPLKLKGRSRIRLGFGFFFCVFTIIFQCRCPPGTAAKPLAFLCFLPDAVFRRAVLLVVSMALFPDG